MNRTQRLKYDNLERFLNATAKTGYVDIKAVVIEMAKLVGLSKKVVP